MRNSFGIVIIFCILLIYNSCTFWCGNGFINLAFIGFSQNDIDTIILKKYEPNNAYSHFIDSVVIDEQVARYTVRNDTTILHVSIGDLNYYIERNFDWQVYIPAKNKTVFISNITSEDVKGTNKRCLDPITSFVQDGQTIIPQYVESDTFYLQGYRAYINN